MVSAVAEPVRFEVRGAAAELFGGGRGEPTVLARWKEVLLEGPRGTGKSFPACIAFHQMSASIPNLRGLILRQTLRSLRESVQVTYETRVLAMEKPALRSAILGAKSRDHRTGYDYPNGSHIALGGMDSPDSWLGADYDWLWVEEARQVSMRALDTVSGNLRNGRLPGWHGLLLTTNPGKRSSALNRRFPDGTRSAPSGGGERLRLLSRHEDNPSVTDDYLARLRLMRGAEYRRLYLGEWCGEEGQVWPEWDETNQVLDMHLEKRGQDWYLVDAGKLQGEAIHLRWFVASFDYGYRVGCLGVWGFDARGNAYCVAEWYRTRWHRPEWSQALTEAHADFGLRLVLCDAPDDRFLDDLNADLGRAHGTGVGQIIRRPDKSAGKERGIQAARLAMEGGHVFFIAERYRLRGGPDPALVEEDKPHSTTDEIPGYVYPDTEDAANTRILGEREKSELPEKGLPDHGCDTLEYLCTWRWGNRRPDLTPPAPPPAPLIFGTVEYFETSFPSERLSPTEQRVRDQVARYQRKNKK